MLPVQRYLNEPRLDFLEFRRWLSPLRKARGNMHERHMRHATECKERLENSNALLPVGGNDCGS